MQVVLFNPEKNGLEQRVVDAIARAGLSDRTEVFSTYKSLSASFLKPQSRIVVVIVIAIDADCPSRLTTLREFLFGYRVILIGAKESIHLARWGDALHARLVLHENDDLSVVTAVLMSGVGWRKICKNVTASWAWAHE